ncbi:MAG: arsenite efflux MFS transporter ArsK [Rhizobiales bacterium]|nr:arsenite efflux MFS transporter ArsK [Hyphomicrobiales bacterium]
MSSAGLRGVIAALGLTQIIGYGTLYYSFSVLAPAMGRDVGWSKDWVFGAFSLALLIGGLVAPWVGRWIDRFGAGRLMAIGSVAAAAALIGPAAISGAVPLLLGLVAGQVAATLVQYSAAFTLLVQIRPEGAQRRITYLTLIAGFASTIFWPLTTAMQEAMTWQQVYLVFAALHLVLCLPAHLRLSRFRGDPRTPPTSGGPADSRAPTLGTLTVAERPRAFTLMVIGFALESFVNAALLVHMLPLLTALGLGAAGVLVGSLFGPAQVLSRLINMIFGNGLSQRGLALISAVLLPVAIAILLATEPLFAGGLVFAVVFGLGSGLSSIVQGTLPLELFGSAGYGQRLGQITSVRLVVSSGAPFAMALMITAFGARWALLATVLLGGMAVLAFLAIGGFARSAKSAAVDPV